MAKNALIVGATGLIGSQLLDLLLHDSHYKKVHVIARKPLLVEHEKLIVTLTDFEELEKHPNAFEVDDVFCCLGTTIKKVGSKDLFKRIDVDYPELVAKMAKSNGANQYLLVSAMGAHAYSKIFYNKVKGQAENAIKKVGFDAIHIFRASLLFGPRKERRIGEKLGQIFASIVGFMLIGPMKKYKGIKSIKVARAMLHYAKQNQSGIFVHESDALQEF